MKVIYTNNIPLIRDPSVCYRNDFIGVIGNATAVEVDDDFPDAEIIKQAYGRLAIPLEEEAADVGSNSDLKLQERLTDALSKLESVEAEKTRLEAENTRLEGELAEEVAEKAALLVDEQIATAKGELASFKNDIPAMKARIAELEAGKGTPDPLDGPTPGDYENWKVDQIKAYLTDKGIEFKQSALKPELIALIPQDPKE
ncbi:MULTISPECIES: HeH/LEM domain protein [Gammaproteobacteria]|uniref:HeH/LEM domain protein n=1 Tax=Acinetobacter TaxID=469 RepID=UPI00202A1315|nr:HeH/LEM domain protein [Acinetobacter pittii]